MAGYFKPQIQYSDFHQKEDLSVVKAGPLEAILVIFGCIKYSFIKRFHPGTKISLLTGSRACPIHWRAFLATRVDGLSAGLCKEKAEEFKKLWWSTRAHQSKSQLPARVRRWFPSSVGDEVIRHRPSVCLSRSMIFLRENINYSLFQNKKQLNFCEHLREKIVTRFLLAPFHPK